MTNETFYFFVFLQPMQRNAIQFEAFKVIPIIKVFKAFNLFAVNALWILSRSQISPDSLLVHEPVAKLLP